MSVERERTDMQELRPPFFRVCCKQPLRVRSQKLEEKTLTRKGDMSMTWEERFWSRVEKTPTCWLWHGGRGQSKRLEYGVWKTTDRKRKGAHVVAYELLVGPMPPGREIDHLCRNTLCVNPAHLEPVTSKENNARRIRTSGWKVHNRKRARAAA